LTTSFVQFIVKKDEDVVAANDPNEVDAPNAVTVNNLVDAHDLQQTSFDKKSYMTYIKGYMKQLKEYLEKKDPTRVPTFQKAATVSGEHFVVVQVFQKKRNE
jgi:hypothetical protein